MVGLFGIFLVSLSKNWTINSRKDLFRNASQYCSYHNGLRYTIKYCKLSKLYRFSLKYILAVRREMQESWSLSVSDPSVSAALARRGRGSSSPSAGRLQLLLMAVGVRHGAGDSGERLSPLPEVPLSQWTPLILIFSVLEKSVPLIFV